MLNLFEELFAVLMLMYLSSGITGFWAGDSQSNVWRLEDNPLLLSIQMMMYAITLALLALHWRKFLKALHASGWLLALALLALVSSLWSSDPSFTLRRSLVLIATTVFGIYFGSRYELARQVRLAGWTFVILAVLSLGCSLMLPQYGIDQQFHQGDWHGIFGQKNLLGKAMAVAIIVFWLSKGIVPRVVRLGALLVCAVLMLKSGSRAALAVSIMLLLMLPCYRILRSRMTTLVPVGMLALSLIAGLGYPAVEHSNLLLALVGRNATLTRRTEVWGAVWPAISRHTLLGYGFSGFWAGLQGESAQIAPRLGFVARHAHNGFLDLWLELGLAGPVLFAAGFVQAVGNGVKLLRMSGDRVAVWPLQYLAFMLIYDLAEGPILRQNNIYWALYVAVVVASAAAVRIGNTAATASLMCPDIRDGELEQCDHLPRPPAGRLGKLHPQTGRSAA